MKLDAAVRKLTHTRCELGEGPHYDPASNTVWWLDIVAGQLYEYRFDDSHVITHPLPKMASLVAEAGTDRQLLAMEDGLYLRNKNDDTLSLLHPLEADNTETRSNDGRVHPSGTLWIGTMGKHAEPEAGCIYWYNGRELKVLYDRISIPNSICFSPDGTCAYFADSAENQLWRVAVHPETGLPAGKPELFLSGSDLPLGGCFDGSVVDADGVLWNAAWGGGSVSGFAPDGTLVGTFEVPAAQVSCPCFVGPTLSSMLVTTAWQSYSDQQRLADPDAGYSFVIDGNFRGVADTAFQSHSPET